MGKILILTCLVLLTGCQAVKPISIAPDPLTVIAHPCTGWLPILINDDDRFSKETAKSVLAHNERGRTMGCW